MNGRKYELMEKYLKNECTVSDLIDRIVELEGPCCKTPNSVTTGYVVRTYLLNGRLEAHRVLDALIEQADRYHAAAVGDYYNIIGVPIENIDMSFGWSYDTIKTASIIPTLGGYLINLPPVEAL